MKHVYKTKELAHVWVYDRAKLGTGRNPQGNFYFSGAVLYSYRDNYPIAKIYDNGLDGDSRAVTINADNYSNTTARHISMARQSTGHMEQFTVPYVLADSLHEHERNLQWYGEQISKTESKLVRSRSNASWHARQLSKLVNEANGYRRFFGVEWPPFLLDDSETMKERVKASSLAERRRKAQEQRDIAVRNQEAIDGWLAGDKYAQVPYGLDRVYLRVVGDNVETSKGAVFPIDHALKGLQLVRAVKARGEAYHRNGHTLHLGIYAIDSIDTDGNVKAGCHYVTYSEIERIAPMIETLTAV